MTEQLHFHFSLSCIGEGNGNPLQCSCLENPRDGESWWADVYGVAQSRTRLKQLSSSSSSSSSSRILRNCISNELPGDAKAAGLGTTLGELEEPPAFSSKQDKLFFFLPDIIYLF